MNITIKALREQKGFSQTYLASYLKVSRQMYIKYESGEVEPPVRVIRELSKLYAVSYDFIIDDKLSEKAQVFQYSDETDTETMVADTSISYGVQKQTDSQIAKLYSQISRLPQKCIPSVSAFILLLQQEEKTARKANLAERSKKAFFDLAGKINLDADEITSFREESMI